LAGLTKDLGALTKVLGAQANCLVGPIKDLCVRSFSIGQLTKHLVQGSKVLVRLDKVLVGLEEVLVGAAKDLCLLNTALCVATKVLVVESKDLSLVAKDLSLTTKVLRGLVGDGRAAGAFPVRSGGDAPAQFLDEAQAPDALACAGMTHAFELQRRAR
jgi:hypothetical protein